MREIKFRYWNDLANKYHYRQEQVLACLSQQITGLYNHEGDGCRFEQYTGLHDKNGREIYEGDIVRDGFDAIHSIVWFNDLGYDGGGATHSGFYFDETYDGRGGLCYHNHMTECEVIGNIHENPELLA